MKKLIICSQFFWFSCGQVDCPKEINRLPMYGQVKKCKEQMDSDKDFLDGCDKQFKTRTEAAKFYVDRGWEYFHKNQVDTAMMRFNQAWLLDSLNGDIYWGYGNILGQNNHFKESLVHFEKSLKINPENPRVWESASTSYGNLFFESKDTIFLNTSIEYLKKSIKLEPNNAGAYGQLTAAYSYFTQKDSANKYLRFADNLDPSAVNPAVREILRAD